MEHIKEAFSKVKQDIDSLKNEINFLKENLKDTRERLIEICDILKVISKKNEEKENKQFSIKDSISENIPPTNTLPSQQINFIKNNAPKNIPQPPTQTNKNPTESSLNSTHPAHNLPYKPQNDQNIDISTGNKGVPTDRQTNQQTNQQTDKGSYNQEKTNYLDSINTAAQILDSLDNLKKEVRLKFKRLTDQEFSVFSIIYQLSEEKEYTDYKNLSEKLGLTESSIRDYVGRLIKKGIPVEKTKINNKTIHLSISPNLKKVASLHTILQLRTL